MKKIMMLIAAAMLGVFALAGCGPSKSDLEEGAKPLVTDIIKEQLGGEAKCLKVTLGEKVDDTHYKAVAKLDNGNDLNIMVEHKDDMIKVTIPLNQ